MSRCNGRLTNCLFCRKRVKSILVFFKTMLKALKCNEIYPVFCEKTILGKKRKENLIIHDIMRVSAPLFTYTSIQHSALGVVPTYESYMTT